MATLMDKHSKTRAWAIGTPHWRSYPDLHEEKAMERLTQVTLVEKEIHNLLPGEATYNEGRQAWFIGCPSPDCGIGNLADHSVTYDEATRLLTVSPSILCGCGAHYFVENNQIRWC
jgi:hypothetical protein